MGVIDEVKDLYDAISVDNNAICDMIGNFIKCFFESTEKLISHMLKHPNAIIHTGDNDKLGYNNFTKYFELCIEHFRSVVEPLMVELANAHSERLFTRRALERSAKLMSVYNNLLLEWDSLHIKNKEKDGDGADGALDNSLIAYFVTSGRADKTDNNDLYNYNHGIFETYKMSRPIIVTIPEAGLYDIEGSIFRLAHEFFHVRGKRERIKRAKCYMDSLNNIFGLYIYDVICDRLRRIKARLIFNNRFYDTS